MGAAVRPWRQETLTRCLTALVAAQEDFSGEDLGAGASAGAGAGGDLGPASLYGEPHAGTQGPAVPPGGLSPGLVLWPGGGGGLSPPRGPGPHCPAGGGGGFPMSLQRPGIDGTPPGGGHPRGPANGGQVPPGTGAAAAYLPEEKHPGSNAAGGVLGEGVPPLGFVWSSTETKGKTRAGRQWEHPPARDIPKGERRAKASDLAGIIRRPWWRTWQQPALPWGLCGAGRCCPGRG